MDNDQILAKIRLLADRGALFVVNHSGGKDSQAMFHVVRRLAPPEQILVIHAHLAGVEWPGTWEHVLATTEGYSSVMVQAKKTFFDMVEARGMFPSPRQRQCTSDLKRDPITTAIRRHAKATGQGLIVNCIGLRAEESSNRARQVAFRFSDRNSKAGREWYEWLPIHELTVDEVFAIIRDNGQEPHWAYAQGMTRLSCVLCIMASTGDLQTAARLQPALYQRYVELEKRIGQTMMMPSKTYGRRFLEDYTGVPASKVT